RFSRDWSSDVCSSDLGRSLSEARGSARVHLHVVLADLLLADVEAQRVGEAEVVPLGGGLARARAAGAVRPEPEERGVVEGAGREIGRASWRERGQGEV